MSQRSSRPGELGERHDQGQRHRDRLALSFDRASTLTCGAAGDHRNSDQRHELALGVGVAVDVPLGGLDRPVARQELHVSQRGTGIVDQPGGPGDEGAAARMGRATLQADCPIGLGEPIDDADRGHRPAALGSNDRTCRLGLAAQIAQRLSAARGGLGSAARPISWRPGRAVRLLGPMSPVGVRTISQVRFAISAARSPALTDNSTISRLRSGMPGRRGEDQEVTAIVFG